MTRRPLRLVPKASNVVDLHSFRCTGRIATISTKRMTSGAQRLLIEQDGGAIAGLADDPRRDAWPYPPCDVEPEPAA